MPAPLRVIIEETPASGAVNMAVDEVLLESALSSGKRTCIVSSSSPKLRIKKVAVTCALARSSASVRSSWFGLLG